jgi:hypothetical protein
MTNGDGKDSLTDVWMKSLKNRPIIAVLVFFGLIVIGLASFTDSLGKLKRFFFREPPKATVSAGEQLPPQPTPAPKKAYFTAEFALGENDTFVAKGVTVKTGSIGISGGASDLNGAVLMPPGPFADVKADADGSGSFSGGRLNPGSSITLHRHDCESLRVIVKDIQLTKPPGTSEEDLSKMGTAAEALVTRKVTGIISGKCEE